MKKIALLTAIFIWVVAALVAQSSPVQYFYDDLGRLTRVVDPSGNVATYTYDAVGNILKISRSTLASPTTLAILNFTPAQGGIGASVTIQGQGFNPTASLNSVTINGASASVVSATSTAIVVTVPANASTGPIAVTTGGQTVTSDTNFTFIPGPAILSINPKSIVSSTAPSGIPNLQITGANLNTATFVFQPVTTPPQASIGSVNVDPSGNSATLSVVLAANASGAFTLVATNVSGSSSQVPSAANTLHVLNPNGDDDNDGLTNAMEIAIGTDPLNASTAGDGISDGWKVFYSFDPLANIASLDTDADGLTNLQEFQAGTDPRNPDVAPPAVSQIFPANQATAYPLNGKVVVRFAEPLLTGVNLSATQSAVNHVASSLSAAAQATAAQVLQSYLQATCCANSINNGVVTLSHGGTPVTGSVLISNDGLSLTFTPSQALTASTVYTVQSNGVRDLAGNRMTAQFQSTFTTGTTNDVAGPTILQTSPVSGATNVPTNVAFTVQFSKRIDPATLSPQAFTMTDTQVNATVAGTLQVDASGLTAAFVPSQPLAIGRIFVARLDTTLVKDTSGNALTGATGFSFTTAFAPDTDNPHLLGTIPLNGDTNIPTNSVIVLLFNEPLNSVLAASGVQVSAGGVPIQAGIALSNSNRQLTVTPSATLVPNTTYTVTVQSSIADMSDRLIDNPGSFSFQTGAGTDTTRATIVTTSPLNGATGVPVNSVMEVQFSKRIDVLTAVPANFQITPLNGPAISGTVVTSADGLSATFTPSAPLVPGTLYFFNVSGGITDLTGQAIIGIGNTFITGVVAQGTGPQVTAVSPSNGSTGVPVNAKVAVQLNEPVEPLSVGANGIVVSAGGTAVAGTISISTDRTILTFTPASLLAVSTVYTITVAGIEDVAGNLVTPLTSSFTTGASGVADTTALTVSFTPANNATGIAVNTPITMTFNKAINATTVNTSSVQISAAGFSGQLAGTFNVNASTVTFTPATVLPGNTRISILLESPLQDVAGNVMAVTGSTFTTGAGVDTVAPRVLTVTPGDGASNIGQNVAIILTLSKSVNSATVLGGPTGTVGVLDGSGVPLSTSVTISADNQTITLRPSSLVPGTVATVVATSGVRDLAGNALVDFRSQFTVAPQFDNAHALVVTQRPGNGATGVPQNSSVVLYVNETLNTSTVAGALHVSQNGVLTPGTLTVRDNGQTIQFVPSTPWQKNAFIQVFLDSTALDSDGNTVNSYQGSFRTVVDTTTIPPLIVSVSPLNNGTNFAPLNPVVEWQYNEPLNPNTVNTNTVLLQNNNTGQFVAGTVTLDASGTFIRFVPNVPLAANGSYSMQTTAAISGTNGLLQPGLTSSSFRTGTASDTTPPVVTLVSPPDGFSGVPVNALVHVRFNEPINPLTVSAASIQLSSGTVTSVASSISFSNNNQDVILTPQDPLGDATAMTITIGGVEDLSGNPVLVKTTQFTTGTGPATSQPVVVNENPISNAASVPLNTLITLQSNVPVDPGSVNTGTFIVNDNAVNARVAGTTSLSSDGRTMTFLPNVPLGINRSISVSFSGAGISDLAGNLLACSSLFCNFSFTTGTASDAQAPTVSGISPPNQLTGVPINTQILIQFNEPVDGLTLSQVVLTSSAGPINTVATLVNGHSTLILNSVLPLNANTQYTINIAGVQDLSGNVMTAPVSSTFTTGPSADLTRATIVTTSPLNGATGVPINSVMEVQFSKRIDVLTAVPANFQITPLNGPAISGTVVTSADGLSATFTPSAPLVPGTLYFFNVSGGITDLTGQAIIGIGNTFITGVVAQGTGPQVTAVSPSNGSTGVPVNAKVAVQLNEPVEPLSVGANGIVVSAGGTAVAGTISISTDRTILTFTPASLLAVSTVYTITVAGIEDVAGNLVTPLTSSFTTGASGVADTTALTVSFTPANNATGIAVNTPITLTFNKAINATTVNTSSVQISAAGFSGQLAGTFNVNASTVTFTPATVLPGNTRISILLESPLQDVAGNVMAVTGSTFTTGAGVDTVAPRVLTVTPGDGASNIGQNVAIILTLSKSVNSATVLGGPTGTVGVLDGSGVPLSTSVTISADNQTITLRPSSLVPGTVATVVATSGVRDLAGNALVDFRSQFTVAPQFDNAHALVVTQRPGNGATGVPQNSSVVLYVNETLNTSTVAGALHVSQNGVLTPGTLTVRDNGQTIQFVPSTPWQKNAFIQVFLDSTALDSDGNTVNSYQGSFRTVVDTTTIPPLIVSVSPLNNGTNFAPLNPVVEWQYNEPLNPNTVNTNTVLLQNNNTGQFVAGTVTLDASGTFIRFVPNVPLAANGSYSMQTTAAISGTNGLLQPGLTSSSFRTGTASDTTPPVVTLVSPPDGFSGVPVNALVHVRFNEPINPLTVSAASIQLASGTVTSVASSISFSNNNQDVILTPQDPLGDATAMTITIGGVEDLSGNPVLVKTTQFTTGTGPATSQPVVVNENPISNAASVPLNTLITLQSNVPVDPGSVNTGTFIVNDNTAGGRVSGNTSVNSDELTVNFLPGGPLTANHNISVSFSGAGISDLAGNLLACSSLFCNFSFTTGTASDAQAPTVSGISPPNQLTGVPINTQILIQFNEPVDGLTLGQVVLTSSAGPINTVATLVNGHSTLILNPVLPLNANTQYTINIAGVQDLSGNVMTAPVSSTFTTGPSADLTRATITTTSPLNGATGVPVNSVMGVQFSKRIDVLTAVPANFQITPLNGSTISGTVVTSADGLSATFTPSAPLVPGTLYFFNVSGGITDLTGQAIIGIGNTFTTAP